MTDALDRLAHYIVGTDPRRTLVRAVGVAVIAAALVLLGVALSGCGASAVQTHATGALYTTTALRVSGETVDTARARALDEVTEHAPPEGRDAAIQAEADRWRPVGAALDAARETLSAWVDAIDLARIAESDDAGLAALVPLARRALALYSRAVTLASSLGEELPALPPWLALLIGGAQ